jgi:hypothetical protein
MKNNTNTNPNPNNVTAVIVDGKLVITLPFKATPKLTKNGRNYIVAEAAPFPIWATVQVDGEEVALNVCALVKNPEHPDNKPQPVAPVAPPVPKFFQKKASSGKVQGNGTVNRLKPASVQ